MRVFILLGLFSLLPTFGQLVRCQLHLGEVSRAQFRLELVEADPLAHVQLPLAVLVVLMKPDQPLIQRVPGARADQDLTAAATAQLAAEGRELGLRRAGRGVGRGGRRGRGRHGGRTRGEGAAIFVQALKRADGETLQSGNLLIYGPLNKQNAGSWRC